MPKEFNLGVGLLELITGGLQGYTRGRAVKAQRQIETEERAKRDKRLQDKEDREIEQRNREMEGLNLKGSALLALQNMPTNVSVDDPVFNDLTSQVLKGATMRGEDPAKALEEATAAILSRQPDRLSELDESKIDTEQERARAAAALADLRGEQVNTEKAQQSRLRSLAAKTQQDQQLDKKGRIRSAQDIVKSLVDIEKRTSEEQKLLRDAIRFLDDSDNAPFPRVSKNKTLTQKKAVDY